MTEQVELHKLQLDSTIQSRTSLDMITIQEYAEDMRNGDEFAPVEVIFDGTQNYYVWDGFHRVSAAREAGIPRLNANVQRGTKQDAQWLALGANRNHGLRRTNEDKRRAVEMALQHPKAVRLSDYQIATHCGVGHTMVSRFRESIYTISIDKTTRQVIRNGSTYTMDTANIGKQNGATFDSTAPAISTDTRPLFAEAELDVDAVDEIELPELRYQDGDEAYCKYCYSTHSNWELEEGDVWCCRECNHRTQDAYLSIVGKPDSQEVTDRYEQHKDVFDYKRDSRRSQPAADDHGPVYGSPNT